jgi:hypothetical protein
MLTNKKDKEIKKKKKKDPDADEDNIQSMRSWVRKIEQSANSISSRLSAVEKRISRGTDPDNNLLTVETSVGDTISKAIVDLQNIDDKDFEELVRILGSELAIIREEFLSQQNEISLFNEKVDDLNDSLSNIKEEIQKTQEYEEQIVKDVNERISKIENRAPPTMKLGKMEVPVEIAGVIAGGIAIFAALLVMLDQQSFLVSPGFLALVGILFIGAALLKTVKITKANKSLPPKTAFTVVKEQ